MDLGYYDVIFLISVIALACVLVGFGLVYLWGFEQNMNNFHKDLRTAIIASELQQIDKDIQQLDKDIKQNKKPQCEYKYNPNTSTIEISIPVGR